MPDRLNAASQCLCSAPSHQSGSPFKRFASFLARRQCQVTQALFLLILLYMLAGCQMQPVSPTESTVAAEEQESTEQDTPSANFEPDTLLSLLTAELAGYRSQPQTALEHYSSQAQNTQSPQIAERAYKIASYLGLQKPALTNALLWARLDDQSADAQRAAATELLKSLRFQEAMQYVEQALILEPDSPGHFDWIALFAGHADDDTRTSLLRMFEDLSTRYPQQSSLLPARAILLQDSDPRQALELVNQYPGLPDSVPVLLLKAQLLQQLEQSEASFAVIRQALLLQPNNEQIRLNYARLLINAGQLEEARGEFLELSQRNPAEDDYRLALGYIHMDLHAWQEAIVYFEELLARDSYTDTALYNLGRCHQELGNAEQAMQAYSAVPAGPNHLAATQRQAVLLLEMNRKRDFNQLFTQAHSDNPVDGISLYLIESETLARHGLHEESWKTIQQALQEYPGEHQLLYTRAMIADKKGDSEQLKQDLRLIIKDNPEHSIALNALGYTLANEGEQLDEALQLILQAHRLDPDDPATLDSLGWVYFRLNQPQKAIGYLEQSFEAYPDAEIAAHLGEVLWSLGEKRKARSVWRTGMELDAEDPVLLETLRRLDNRKGWFK